MESYNTHHSVSSFSHITILLLLLLSRFSCVRLCATPQTAAHQAPPSLGLSRQEHWSGLPFPSPMYEREKGKWLNCSRPHGLQPTRLLHPWDFPGKSTEWGASAFSAPNSTAAAKSLQSCPTLCDPIEGSPPAPPSLGLSRQEHWSGLPLPSPMRESEKWKGSRSVVSDS